MKFEYINTIRCTEQEAWTLVMDLERRGEWIHFIDKTKWVDKKEGIIGSTYDEKLVFLGIPLHIRYTVEKYTDLKLLSAKCKMPPLYPIVDVTLEKSKIPDSVDCGLIFEISLGPFALIPKSILKSKVDQLILPLVNEFMSILERESSLNK
jgi:hypothetical protein